MNHRRLRALLGSALAALAAVAVLPGPASAAGTVTLSAQTAYNCQLFTSPPPPDMYEASVTASIQLTAPSSVSPGQTINLSGTLTLQFPESIREVAIIGGFNTVQGVSTTINLGVDAAGQSSDVFADEWQTPPTQVGNPLQVSGVLTMPPLTVPKNATGDYVLQMPENGATPNTVESTPARVAFTAVATASGPGGTSPIKVACYLPGSSPELGEIPIVAAPTAASKSAATGSKSSGTTSASGTAKASATSKSSGAGSAATTAASGATKATTAAAATGASSPATTGHAAGAGTASGAGATSGAVATPSSSSHSATATPSASAGGASAGTPATAAANTGTAASVASGSAAPSVDAVAIPAATAAPTRSGVYVSTSLLVLGGFVVCLASLGYALLTRYRLNAIRRELDD